MAIFTTLIEYWPRLLVGLAWTATTCLLAAIIAVLVGLILATLVRSRITTIRWFARGYIDLMRGTPIIVILFLLYYAAPSVGVRLEAQTVGVFGLGFYGGAYFAEVFRAGLASISSGQIEAATMLGMTKWQIVCRIKFPMALTLIVPPSVNQLIMLVKESAVLSVITVPELTAETTKIVNETFEVIGPYLAMAILYWILIETLSFGGRLTERWATRFL